MNPLQHLSRTRQVSPRDEASPTARQRQSGSPVAQTHAEGKIKAAKGLLGSKTIMLVICGLVVLGGVAYLWHTTRRSQEQEDERRRRRLELRSQALPQLPPNVGFPGAEQTQQQGQVQQAQAQQQPQAQAQQAHAQAQAQQAQAQQVQAQQQAQAQQVQAQAQAQQVQAQAQAQAQQQAQAHALEQQLVYANEGNGNTVLPQLSSMQDLIEKTRRISLQCSSLHTIYGKARQLVPLCGQPLLDDLAQTKRAQPVEDKPIASTAPSPASEEVQALAQAQAQVQAQAQAQALAQAQAQAEALAQAQAQAQAQALAQAQAAAQAQTQAQAAAQALLDQRAFAAQMESNRAQELARQQALEAEIGRAQAAAQAAQIEVDQLHRDAQDKVAAATAAPEDPAPAPVTDLVVVDEEVKPTRPKRARAKKRPNDSMVL